MEVATAKWKRSYTWDFISSITCWCEAVVQILWAVMFDTILPSSMSTVKISPRLWQCVFSIFIKHLTSRIYVYTYICMNIHDHLHLLFYSIPILILLNVSWYCITEISLYHSLGFIFFIIIIFETLNLVEILFSCYGSEKTLSLTIPLIPVT